MGERVRSYLLDLIEPHFDRGLPAEDRYQHLEPLGILVDLRDLAGEVRQRAGDDLDGFADRELGAAARADLLLAVEQAVDLVLGKGDRLVGGADEPRDSRSSLHQAPGV